MPACSGCSLQRFLFNLGSESLECDCQASQDSNRPASKTPLHTVSTRKSSMMEWEDKSTSYVHTAPLSTSTSCGGVTGGLANLVKDIVWWVNPPLPRQDPADFLLRPPRPQICSRHTRPRPLAWSERTRCSSTCRRRFRWFILNPPKKGEAFTVCSVFLWYGLSLADRRLPGFPFFPPRRCFDFRWLNDAPRQKCAPAGRGTFWPPGGAQTKEIGPRSRAVLWPCGALKESTILVYTDLCYLILFSIKKLHTPENVWLTTKKLPVFFLLILSQISDVNLNFLNLYYTLFIEGNCLPTHRYSSSLDPWLSFSVCLSSKKADENIFTVK